MNQSRYGFRPFSGLPSLGAPFTLFAFCILSPSHLLAQEPQVEIRVAAPEEIQELTLKDGSVLFGQVTTAGDPFTFKLLSGAEMVVSIAQVGSLKGAAGEVVVEGEFWRDDPNQTRLFFGPTARPLKKGTGHLGFYEICLPFVGAGITDNFMLAGGTIFRGGGLGFWLAPKFTFLNTDDTQAAVGVLAFSGGEDESEGIIYGVITRGGTKASLTVGLGYGYTNDELAENPTFIIGGEIRTSRRVKFVTENYLLSGGRGFVSAGPRFFGEHFSVDLGLLVPLGWWEGFLIGFPFINFVLNV